MGVKLVNLLEILVKETDSRHDSYDLFINDQMVKALFIKVDNKFCDVDLVVEYHQPDPENIDSGK